MSQGFRFKNIDETRNYFLEEIKENKLMCKKHKEVCATLNYIEHFPFFLQLLGFYSYRNYEFCNRIKITRCI